MGEGQVEFQFDLVSWRLYTTQKDDGLQCVFQSDQFDSPNALHYHSIGEHRSLTVSPPMDADDLEVMHSTALIHRPQP